MVILLFFRDFKLNVVVKQFIATKKIFQDNDGEKN